MSDLRGSVRCSHPRCKHRTPSSHCGLVAAGREIQLNVIGQCEFMEEHLSPSYSAICQQSKCSATATVECAICGVNLCPEHTHFYPNLAALTALDDRERLQPGSVTDEDRAKANTPVCHVCSIRFAPPIPAEMGYTPVDDDDE